MIDADGTVVWIIAIVHIVAFMVSVVLLVDMYVVVCHTTRIVTLHGNVDVMIDYSCACTFAISNYAYH